MVIGSGRYEDEEHERPDDSGQEAEPELNETLSLWK